MGQITAAEAQAAYRARRLVVDPDGFRAYQREIRRAWRKNNLEKNRAYNRVYRATRSGVLVRPNHCAHCGQTCRPQAAHTDYSRPLDVLWLCPPCHGAFDARQRKVKDVNK